MEADVALQPKTDQHMRMLGFQCWFCGQGIEQADTGAIVITMENLWRWKSGSAQDGDPMQCVYAHAACAKERLQGTTADLDPNLFDESDEED